MDVDWIIAPFVLIDTLGTLGLRQRCSCPNS